MTAVALAALAAASILPAGDLSGAAVLPGAPPPVDPAAGWSARGGPGFAWPAPGAPARLVDDTTLVSPPVVVPVGAQTLGVASSSRNALLVVTAAPLDGGQPVQLGVVGPGDGPRDVPVAALAGRTVRVVLDPVGALGDTVDVASVGPFAAVLPGWDVAGNGLAVPTRGVAQVRRDPARITSPAVAAGPRATALLVRARGAGTLRARAGGRAAAAGLTRAWRDVRVPLSRRGGARLSLSVDPEGGVASLAQIGVIVRRPALRVGRPARAGGGGVAVTGTVRGCRAAAVVVRAGGRRVAGPVRGGRFRVVLRGARPGVVRVATAATRTCDPAAARARVTARVSR